MTIRTMYRAFALVAVALVVSACGDDSPAVSAEDLDAARATAESAVEQVEELTNRIDDLESELSDSRKSAKGLAADLDAAVADLKASLKDLRGQVGAAAADAEDAVGDIAAVARRITVLEERYEFHLKRYHGGG